MQIIVGSLDLRRGQPGHPIHVVVPDPEQQQIGKSLLGQNLAHLTREVQRRQEPQQLNLLPGIHGGADAGILSRNQGRDRFQPLEQAID